MFLFKNHINLLLLYKYNIKTPVSLNLITDQFFNTGLSTVLKKILVVKNLFLTNNLVKSYQYWILKTLNNQINNQNTFLVQNTIQPSKRLLFNIYTSNLTVLSISLHNKYYRIAMLKFLNSIITN